MSVIVLGAGRGERMGVPKAAMRVGEGEGRVWIDEQAERLAKVRAEVTWVLSVEAVRAVEAAGGHVPLGDACVLADAGMPMFVSFLRGLEALGGAERPWLRARDGVFVLPIDVPAPSAAVFAALSKVEDGCVGVPVWGGKRGHPVYLTWKWVVRHVLSPAPETVRVEESRLDRLIGPSVVEVEVDDADVGVNLNTPEDVAAWVRGRSA